MANDDNEDERDPNQDPVIAGALERMQKRLKPGEDPFFYDIARDPTQTGAAAEVPSEENKHVYVGPKTLPPIGDHKTIPNARVVVADPRKMPTLKRIERTDGAGAAVAGDSVDAVVSPVAEAARVEPSAAPVGPRGTAKMATVTANASEESLPSSSRREPAASPWAKEAEETPLLARDLPSSHAPGPADEEAPAPEEKKRSKLPVLLVFAAILLVAFIGVRMLNGSGPTTNAAQPSAGPNAVEPPAPTHQPTSLAAPQPPSPSIAASSPSASASAEEESPGTEPQTPAPSATALVEGPRPRAPATPKPSVEPAATAQPTATTAASGPKFVPPFQFPDEKKK